MRGGERAAPSLFHAVTRNRRLAEESTSRHFRDHSRIAGTVLDHAAGGLFVSTGFRSDTGVAPSEVAVIIRAYVPWPIEQTGWR